MSLLIKSPHYVIILTPPTLHYPRLTQIEIPKRLLPFLLLQLASIICLAFLKMYATLLYHEYNASTTILTPLEKQDSPSFPSNQGIKLFQAQHKPQANIPSYVLLSLMQSILLLRLCRFVMIHILQEKVLRLILSSTLEKVLQCAKVSKVY